MFFSHIHLDEPPFMDCQLNGPEAESRERLANDLEGVSGGGDGAWRRLSRRLFGHACISLVSRPVQRAGQARWLKTIIMIDNRLATKFLFDATKREGQWVSAGQILPLVNV